MKNKTISVLPEIITQAANPIVTGSEAVILSLLAEGVDTIFGYPGGAIMPVYDALYNYQHAINHVLVRHEQGATHAAQGYARIRGKAGVCFATSGPGATNLITGIADAQIDSTPLVCITGQVASPLLGTDAFQETDVIGISMPVTKWNIQVTRAQDIPHAIAKAFFIAQSGRPGPVLIDITKDAQIQMMEFAYEKCEKVRTYVPLLQPDEVALHEAAELINNAKRPYLLAGHGILISGAENELLQFVEKTGIPVANTLLGLSSFPNNHPLYVGYLGMHGNYAPNMLTNQCDVLIAVGMRFDDRVTGKVAGYAKQAKVIHIDIDPSEIDKIIKADVPIVADAKQALQQLCKLVKPNKHEGWLDEFAKLTAIEHEKVILPDCCPESGGIKMAEVVCMLSEKTNGNAVVVTDVGQHQMVTSRYYRFQKPNTNITSGGLGTMGFGLPAALGAKLANPENQVVAILGDGGFQMTLQELATIYQTGAAVKIIVLNNNFLGMVRQWQEMFFEGRYSFTEMVNPNFVAVAQGFYIEAEKIDNRDNLEAALTRMLEADKPFLLEVVVAREEKVFPMVPAGASIDQMVLE